MFDRLYSSSKVSAADLESARIAVAASQLAECTFHPDIARSKRSATASGVRSSIGGSGAGGEDSEDPFSRLYKHAAERQQRKVKAIEEATEATSFPFSPEISEVSRRITESMRDSATGDLPRHLLLYEDGLQRQQASNSGSRAVSACYLDSLFVCLDPSRILSQFSVVYLNFCLRMCLGPHVRRGEPGARGHRR